MPWNCPTCGRRSIPDSDPKCLVNGCQGSKAAWTMAPSETKTMTVVSRKKALYYRFEGGRGVVKQVAEYDKKSMLEAEAVMVTDAALAKKWMASKVFPPHERVFVVRMMPDKAVDSLKVTLTVRFERKAVKPVDFVDEKPELVNGKYHDFRFLFVHGEAAGELQFEGMRVVDVTDAVADGKVKLAPRVDVKAFSKSRTLAIDEFQKGWALRLSCKQLEFNHDSYLLLPEGLAVLHLVLQHASYARNANRRLMICGHTDATGSEEHNLELSRNRTLNIIHMLDGDRSAWAANALANYTHLLGVDEAKARKDVDGVLAWSGASALKGSDWQARSSWEAVYDLYEQALVDLVSDPLDASPYETRRTKLVTMRQGVKWADPEKKAIGCGEAYLRIKTQGRQVANRRDEFLWFDADRLPWAAGQAPADEGALEAIYGPRAEWDYDRKDGPYTFDELDCPKPPRIEAPPGDVVFVIDCSGSMQAKDGARTKSRFILCREELIATLRDLPHDRKFALVQFASGAGRWQETMVPAAREQKSSACQWIGKLLPNGATNTHDALVLAFQNAGRDGIVVLSDGLPTVGNCNERKLLNKVRTELNKDRKVRIDCYGFIDGAGPVSEPDRARLVACFDKRLAAEPLELTLEQKTKLLEAAVSDAGLTLEKGQAEQALLGWFLRELAESNGGKFRNLYAPI